MRRRSYWGRRRGKREGGCSSSSPYTSGSLWCVGPAGGRVFHTHSACDQFHLIACGQLSVQLLLGSEGSVSDSHRNLSLHPSAVSGPAVDQ